MNTFGGAIILDTTENPPQGMNIFISYSQEFLHFSVLQNHVKQCLKRQNFRPYWMLFRHGKEGTQGI